MKDTLLIIPPFTQLSSPHAAVPFLAGTLNGQGYPNRQLDLSITIALRLFSPEGLERIFSILEESDFAGQEQVRLFLQRADSYINTVEPVIDLLQGRDSSFAYRIAARDFLPEGERFALLETLNFDQSDTLGFARVLCSLYIDDISDLLGRTILPGFALSNYRERLVKSYNFEDLYSAAAQPTLLTELLEEELAAYDFNNVGVAAITIPFPGNLLAAMQIGAWIKANRPGVKVVFGGGYVNTELNYLKEPRIFDFTDYICMDNGELPLIRVIDHICGKIDKEQLVRTFLSENGNVTYYNCDEQKDLPLTELGTPDYSPLPLDRYLSLIETTNPMHRLWSERGFYKVRLALGCYYHGCTFCDATLDYIGCYKPLSVPQVVEQIKSIIEQTGSRNFHFVDEAMPPKLVKELALELIRQNVTISYWGNIRFEKSFDHDLCRLLKKSGLIAVTAGLETADDRLLKLINKGTTIEQAIEVSSNFSRAGVLVHSYLIYGLPTETPEELFNSMEIIRQMFRQGVIRSAYYHRFALTIHSEIYKKYREYGIELQNGEVEPNSFANNDIEYTDRYYETFDELAYDIERALYNFNYLSCLDETVDFWFGEQNLPIKVAGSFVKKIVKKVTRREKVVDSSKRVVWIGEMPLIYELDGEVVLLFSGNRESYEYALPESLAEWIVELCEACSPSVEPLIKLADFAESFPTECGESFEDFLNNEVFTELRRAGLLLV